MLKLGWLCGVGAAGQSLRIGQSPVCQERCSLICMIQCVFGPWLCLELLTRFTRMEVVEVGSCSLGWCRGDLLG